jgi:hypothetical protein
VHKIAGYLFQNIPDRDLVGLTIHNTESAVDKPIGISFRSRDQQQSDLMWEVWSKLAQSYAWFAITDALEVRLDHITMRSGNDRVPKTKG